MNYITIVNPEMRPGPKGNPRQVEERDLISVPVSRPGTFTLMDMLSNSSIRNTLAAYGAIGGNTDARRK